MKRHFVRYFSFMAETTDKPIEKWDVDAAVRMAGGITERYNARPYAFQFIARERSDEDLDSTEVASSPIYFLGGRVETLEEVEARNDPSEGILRRNMRMNDYKRIIVNENSWRWTQPLRDGDIVLDVILPEKNVR